MYSSNLSHSLDPSAIRGLSPEQQQRLTDVLDQYLRALDDGLPPTPEDVIAAHPDLAASLRIYLQGLDQLHGMAAGLPRVAEGSSAQDGEPFADSEHGRLGDFVLGREIGRGGMGVVYEAHQLSLNRRVALKVLPFAAVFDAKQIARFKNEAQAAAQLHHPNIVPVFAVGMERGVHYYAMQFIEGQPLDRAIAQLREDRQSAAWGAALSDSQPAPMPGTEDPDAASCRSFLSERTANRRAYFNTVVRLGIQAAEALHAAHEYGIVHRDVKPSNLLLDQAGKLWITDFGLARFHSDGTLTRSGDVVGTRRYMSPEQAAGNTALVDHRTDVYSLAVTLYELLTLQPALASAAAADAWGTLDQQEPPRLRRVSPDIPKDLETVVRKAMSPVRDERYDTAQQLADDLRHVLAGEPTLAQPPTLSERTGKWMRRHRRLVASALATCLVVAAGCVVSTVLIARQTAIADHNYQRAEDNYHAARRAVDRFGSQLAERLAEVPGASQVRRQLLSETIRYYRDFAQQAADDPELQADLALTYSKIAALEEECGSSDAALEAHQLARDLYAQLAAAEPGEPRHRRHLALCWNKLGRGWARIGRVEEAAQAYGEAMRIQQRLVSKSNAAECLSDLALSHNNLGLLRSETGAFAAAEQEFREALRLQEQRADHDPLSAQQHRNLAATCNNLGGLYTPRDATQAVAWFEQAVKHLQEAVTAQPSDLAGRNQLAQSYCNLGAARAQSGEWAAAESAYQQAIDLQTQLVRAAPASGVFRRDLAVSLNNQGLMWSKLQQVADAEQAFRRALDLQETLVAQDPADLAQQSSLAGVYNNLGIVLEERQQVEQAADAYQQAIAHQRVAFERAGTMARYRTFLSKHYFNYGRALRQLGRAEEAVQAAVARRELWPREPQHLLAVAEELALAGQLPTDASHRATAETAVNLALETLQQAIAAGATLPVDFETKASFAALRGDQRFTDLVGK